MANYLELYNLYANGGALLSRFEIACLKAANDVINESPATEAHAARVQWAHAVLLDPRPHALRILRRAIASNTTLQVQGEGVTDGDIQFIVNGLLTASAQALSIQGG